MKFSKFGFAVFFTVLLFDVMFAQSSVTPSSYFCNFEDAAENGKWNLQVGRFAEKCANKWYIGEPGATNKGEAGLFISCDNGLTSNYTNKAVMVMAYRELTLEAGDYELSFDWKAGGTEYDDGLYICLVPSNVRLASDTSSVLDNWVKIRPDGGYALDFGRDNICLNQRYWNTVVDSINISAGETYNLIFIWRNDLSKPYFSGACIDNIMIKPKGVCNRPTDFKVNPKGTDVLLSWSGDADAYDVRIYDCVTETWSEYKNIKDKYLELKGLEEGMKSFFVRSVCDTVDTVYSAWTSRDKFFYHSTLSCIDFLNLTSQNCYISTRKGNNNGKSAKVVDYGSLSVYSRHTIHWDKNERDPRTNGELKTVPDGEFASVRLGNSSKGGEVDEIEYNLYVDSSSAVLLLNYAVVLQDAMIGGNHYMDPESKPRFTLRIRDGVKSVEKGCGDADFLAGSMASGEDGWHEFETGMWKDWTTVAIDLRDYLGKSLKITFTSMDCGDGGHFGYAYFTLRCTDGKIQGLTCGGGNDKDSTEFLAPEGFKYRWYSPDSPGVTLSTKQRFSIAANDTSIYYVDIIQPTNSDCYYTEHVSGVGRWPQPKADYEFDIKNCENNVRFENKSFVKLVNQISNESSATTDKCDVFFWDFGDGDTSIVENPVHRYPDEGGTYTVRLKAAITGGCDNWTSFDITLPNLLPTSDTMRTTICRNELPYEFGGDTLFDTGIYVDTLQNIYGCDSIIVLDLFVADKFDTIMYDTIPAGEEYYFRGKLLSESGVYVDTTQSPYGCDSIFTIYFEVIEPMNISLVDGDIFGCEDDDYLDVNFEFGNGTRMPVEYSIYFDNNALSQGFVNQERISLDEIGNEFVIILPENCAPDTYTATFLFYDTTFVCSDVSIPVSFDVGASILQAKFDNLIVVIDEGYGFVDGEYEWYVNNVMDSSVVDAFYYLPDGQTFGEDDCYYMIATRGEDGKKIRTCEICPGVYTSVDDIYDSNGMLQVTIFDKEQIIETDIEKGSSNIYSLAGELLTTYEFGVDRIKAPAKSGLYILQIVLEDRNYTYKILVK